MKIKLNELSDEQIIQYLRIKCFKIETHEVTYQTILSSYKRECRIAVPIDEEYNPEKHKSIHETFRTVLHNSVGNFLLHM